MLKQVLVLGVLPAVCRLSLELMPFIIKQLAKKVQSVPDVLYDKQDFLPRLPVIYKLNFKHAVVLHTCFCILLHYYSFCLLNMCLIVAFVFLSI